MKRLNNTNLNSPARSNRRFRFEVGGADNERTEALAKYYTGGTYLDLGCSNSKEPGELKKKFPEERIVGVDFSQTAIEYMQEQFPDVEYICSDIYDVDIKADYIVMGEVLEHMEDPKRCIDHCLSLLNPGGWLAISTPLNEGEKFWLDPYEHIWSFSEEDILALLPGAEIGMFKNIVIMAWYHTGNVCNNSRT